MPLLGRRVCSSNDCCSVQHRKLCGEMGSTGTSRRRTGSRCSRWEGACVTAMTAARFSIGSYLGRGAVQVPHAGWQGAGAAAGRTWRRCPQPIMTLSLDHPDLFTMHRVMFGKGGGKPKVAAAQA